MASGRRNKELRCAMGQRKGEEGGPRMEGGGGAPPKKRGRFPAPPSGLRSVALGGFGLRAPRCWGKGEETRCSAGISGRLNKSAVGLTMFSASLSSLEMTRPDPGGGGHCCPPSIPRNTQPPPTPTPTLISSSQPPPPPGPPQGIQDLLSNPRAQHKNPPSIPSNPPSILKKPHGHQDPPIPPPPPGPPPFALTLGVGLLEGIASIHKVGGRVVFALQLQVEPSCLAEGIPCSWGAAQGVRGGGGPRAPGPLSLGSRRWGALGSNMDASQPPGAS